MWFALLSFPLWLSARARPASVCWRASIWLQFRAIIIISSAMAHNDKILKLPLAGSHVSARGPGAGGAQRAAPGSGSRVPPAARRLEHRRGPLAGARVSRLDGCNLASLAPVENLISSSFARADSGAPRWLAWRARPPAAVIVVARGPPAGARPAPRSPPGPQRVWPRAERRAPRGGPLVFGAPLGAGRSRAPPGHSSAPASHSKSCC